MVFLHSCRLKFTLPCYISKNYVSTFPDWYDFFSFPHVSDFNFKFGIRFYFSYFNIRLSYLGCFCQKDMMFLLYKDGTHKKKHPMQLHVFFNFSLKIETQNIWVPCIQSITGICTCSRRSIVEYEEQCTSLVSEL